MVYNNSGGVLPLRKVVMTVDSEVLSSMYAEILRGTPKDQSRYVSGEESSRLWDQITAEVEAQRTTNPDTVFEIPAEIPGAPKTPVEVTTETPADQPTDPAPTPAEGVA